MLLALLIKPCNNKLEYGILGIYVYNSKEEYIKINYEENTGELFLYIERQLYELEITDKRDICKWNLLLEDVKEYIAKSIENKFNNFFEEEPKKYKNIEDLDDKDD